MPRLFLITLLCGLLLAQTGKTPPPTPADAQDTVITVGVDIVTTPALVFDKDGGFISGLEAKDFRLFDNGKLQNITVDVSFIPISLVICIQANSHVQGLLPQVNQIGNMIQPLLIGDHGEA